VVPAQARPLRVALAAGLGLEGIGKSSTVTTIEALGRELDLTATRGRGLAQQEAEDGAIEADGKIVGTMSVAAPLTRLPDARIAEILPMLRAAADNMAIARESA
jgi:DNA-binding IclR family transcriptional regulator